MSRDPAADPAPGPLCLHTRPVLRGEQLCSELRLCELRAGEGEEGEESGKWVLGSSLGVKLCSPVPSDLYSPQLLRESALPAYSCHGQLPLPLNVLFQGCRFSLFLNSGAGLFNGNPSGWYTDTFPHQPLGWCSSEDRVPEPTSLPMASRPVVFCLTH